MAMNEEMQEARLRAASDARLTMRTSVMRMVEAAGGEVRERPAWRGANRTTRYAEPSAGIRAALVLKRAAASVLQDYIRSARRDGLTWREIGTALELEPAAGERGISAAERAFDFAAPSGASPWASVTFCFECGSCGETIRDQGPYESHPEDSERGHADECERFAAQVTTWQAERDADADEAAEWLREPERELGD